MADRPPLTRALLIVVLTAILFSGACTGRTALPSAVTTPVAQLARQFHAPLPTPRLATPAGLSQLFPLPTPPITGTGVAVGTSPEPDVASPTAFMLPTVVPATPPSTIAPPSTAEPLPLAALPPPEAALPPELGVRGDTWTVLFTPGGVPGFDLAGQLIMDSLIDYIDAAQQTIDLAVYELNLTPVAEALIRAHNRGVRVRFVTDDEAGLEADAEEDHGQFALMAAAGIEVRSDTRSALMHNKFIIIDNAIFMTGSTNLTVNDIFKNNNNAVIAYLPEVAAIYEREFEEMWNGEFGPTSPAQSGQAVIAVNGQPFVVLFAPEDDPFDTLVQLVSAAQTSIRFMAFSFTNDALGLAMLERFQDGVDVRGIVEVRGSETEYAELPRLYCAGVPVYQDGNPQTFHHKVVVIDNYVVITGSMNFSDSAAESNDENMVALSDPGVALLFLQEFNRRWEEATPPLPEDMNCP